MSQYSNYKYMSVAHQANLEILIPTWNFFTGQALGSFIVTKYFRKQELKQIKPARAWSCKISKKLLNLSSCLVSAERRVLVSLENQTPVWTSLKKIPKHLYIRFINGNLISRQLMHMTQISDVGPSLNNLEN